MTVFAVTTSNWNSPAFWSSINVTTGRHVLDFSGLPSNFNLIFDPTTDMFTMSDGATSFVVTDDNYAGPPMDASLGGTTVLSFFSLVGTGGDDDWWGDNSAETIDGGAGNDTLLGWYGNDSILGGAGDDSIQGQFGNDTVDGGAGSDMIETSSAAGVEVLRGGESTDDADILHFVGTTGVSATFSGDEAGSYTMGANSGTFSQFEVLRGTEGADTINAALDTGGMVLEGQGGADSITGGSGADLIRDGSGNDTIRGGDGADSIGDWGTSTGADVFYGGGGNDSLIGGSDADTLFGDAGDDYISGAAGNDQLFGGDGADLFAISDDHDGDTIDGGSGGTDFDQIAFWDVTSTGGVSATFGGTGFGTYAFAATAGLGTFAEIEGIYGTQHNDTINAAADSGGLTLWGGSGDDTVTGGSGNDVVYAESGADTVAGGAGDDSLYAGDGADQLTGGSGDDALWGEAGNDTVFGGDGADTIDGGAGLDLLLGQNDADLFYVGDGFGGDIIIGGEGVTSGADLDALFLAPVTTGVTVTYSGTGIGTVTASGDTLTFSEIEAVTGTSQNDSIDLRNDTLGASIDGALGDDTIRLGTGQDTVLAGEGADRVFGNAGDDLIQLGAGDDSIDYGWAVPSPFGVDTVLGGDGADTLDMDALNYADFDTGLTGTITDAGFTFTNGADTITGSGIEVFQLTYGGDTIDASASTGGVSISTRDGSYNGINDDVIIGGSGNDTIYTADGHAVITGGAGDDVLSGINGDKTFVFEDGFGNDTVDISTGTDTFDFSGLGAQSVTATMTGSAGVVMSGGDSVTIVGTNWNAAEVFVLSGNADSFDASGATLPGVGNQSGYTVDAGAGNDTLTGAGLSDTLSGGAGDDVISGGTTAAHLRAGDGDTIIGTMATDLFVWTGAAGDSSTIILDDGSGTANDADGHDEAIYVEGAGDGSTLRVEGFDHGDDTIFVSEAWTGYSESFIATGHHQVILTYASGATQTFDIYHDGTTTFGAAQFAVRAYRDAMADSLSGGDGNDTITGGEGADTLLGGNDADRFLVQDAFGNDTILGGEGGTDLDVLDFGALGSGITVTGGGAEAGTATDGFDTLSFSEVEQLVLTAFGDNVTAGTGAMSVAAGAGDDTFLGGIGDDTVDGGAGNDSLTGGDGNDYIDGGAGDDFLSTGLGQDTLIGGDGNDTLMNAAGDDSLVGGAGDDSIVASAGNDTLEGGDGNDTLVGGIDQDRLTGGLGNDVFVYAAGDGSDTITDFNAGNGGTLSDSDATNNDSIDLSGFYDNIWELYADQADDGILNQSNTIGSTGKAVDYSDNTQFLAGDGLTFTGASADSSFFTIENTGVVCFAKGTLIRTPTGQVAIETLRPGDLVQTLDNGVQPVIWVTQRRLNHAQLMNAPNLRPVVLAPALTGGFQPLRVSPQHGILLNLGQNQRLYRAGHLSETKGGLARVAQGCRSVTYVHLMFERHQILFANGAAAESFYPGPQAIASLSVQARRALARIRPEILSHRGHEAYGPPARPYAHKSDVPPHQQFFARCRVPHPAPSRAIKSLPR